jgi:hypothetical protein
MRALRRASASDRGRRRFRVRPALAGPAHALPPRSGPRAPLADTLAVLQEAARVARVALTIVADRSKLPPWKTSDFA